MVMTLHRAKAQKTAARAKHPAPPTKMANPAVVADAGDGVAVVAVKAGPRVIGQRGQMMPLRLMPLRATMPLAQPATSLLTPLWRAKRPSAPAAARVPRHLPCPKLVHPKPAHPKLLHGQRMRP